MKYNFLFSLILYFVATANALYAQTIQGSFESMFQRYQKGQQFVGTPSFTENLTAWKNERVYAEVVIWSQANQNNLSYETSPLTGSIGSIPAEAVQLLFAHNVLADHDARNCGTYPQPRMDSVEVADALSCTPLTFVSPGDPIKMWVRINVPGDIPAGVYHGTIKVKQNDAVQLSFALNIEVLDKIFPDRTNWTFHLDIWQYPYQLLKYYNLNHPNTQILPWSDSHFNMIRPLYEQLADAGQQVTSAYITDDVMGQPSMVKWILKTDNTWQYDFTAMDAWIDLLASMGISKQINCFSTMGMGIDSLKYYDEATASYKRMNMPMFSQTYYDRWTNFLTAFKGHLTSRNIFDKTVLYLDEVESELIPKLDSLIHDNDSAWKIGLSYFRPLTEMENNIMYDIAGNLEFATSLEREGKISTFYTSCAQTIPNTYVTPENSPAESAWMAWYAANRNLNGYLRWAYDFWTLDDPLNVQDGFFTSGENSFVYRSTNEMNAEIYTSYRLEMLRKGIQDYEKIRILKTELSLSVDPRDIEALNMLNEKIERFHENSGTGAKELVAGGTNLLNDIVRGNFSYCKVSCADSVAAYTRWLGVTGSTTPIGNTWVGNCPGDYSHYTDGRITALPGDTITLTVENSPESNCARTMVWIDWNGDLDFDDSDECVWSGGTESSCNNLLSNTFNVVLPSGTKPGIKRMRIQVRDSYAGEPSPCGVVSWSSTRDFDLVVADSYCVPLTKYNKLYFVRKASTSSCVENFDFSNEVMPSEGYIYDDANTLTVEKGTSFLLDIENSQLSKCARTAIWIDWNRNNRFEDEGELVAMLGDSVSCNNPLYYRVPIAVPSGASLGETRMRIQLRDSYQDAPESCVLDNVTGTTDLKLQVVEASGVKCLPRLISPYDGEILPDTNILFSWDANNHTVTKWKIKITNADSNDSLPVYYEQTFEGMVTSTQVSGLPQYGENLLVELAWQIDNDWYSVITHNKATDLYCLPKGFSDISYYINSLSCTNAIDNVSFLSGDSPENGYCRIKNSSIKVIPGSTFDLDIKESSASKCAYTKVWIDWNGDGDFTGSGEEIYTSGLPENCNNSDEHTITIDVPADVSVGMKRLRIRLCNSWLSPLQPCGGSSEITTYDIDLEIIPVSQLKVKNEKVKNLKSNTELKLSSFGNWLYIDFSQKINIKKPTHVFFYKIDGRLVKSLKNHDNPVYIGDIPSGVYLVVVKNLEGDTYSTKIVK